MNRIFVGMFVTSLFLGVPGVSFAADLQVSGWIPWWQDSKGILSASSHLDTLDGVYPFSYEVQSDGSLKDKAGMQSEEWQSFLKKARAEGVAIIPSVIWADSTAIHATLTDSKKRAAHVKAIAELVKSNNFDGINIDYESKKAETNVYFSLFLLELKLALMQADDKKLTCTVEARVVPERLGVKDMRNVAYANNFTFIGTACDEVELMAYDQQRTDVTLNTLRKGLPYAPVADTVWVEEVIKLALKEIPAQKVVLGVPTYGRIWEVQVGADWYKTYTSLRSINFAEAEALAKEKGVQSGRNPAGEVSFSYFAEPYTVLNSLPTPASTAQGFEASAKALLFATQSKTEVPVRVAWYPDAQSVKEKVSLAKKYSLKGVALFKIDGDEPEGVWDSFVK